jgi:opacity protein-like surface antigen
MKNLITLSLLLIATLWGSQAHAQLQRGTRFFGNTLPPGGAGFNSHGTPSVHSGWGEAALTTSRQTGVPGEDRWLSFALAPQYGGFVSDNLLVGGSLTFFTLSDLDDNGSASVLSLNPFARYYLNPGSANNHVYGQIGASYTANLGESGENFWSSDLGLGLTHFLAPGLAFDTYAFYGISDWSESGTGSLGLSAGLNVFFGQEQREGRSEAASGFGRGSLMIGGTSGGFGFNSSPTSRFIQLSLRPQALYFLSSQFAVGGGLDFSLAHTSAFANFTAAEIRLIPQARYYFSAAPKRQQWFAAAGLEIGRSGVTIEDGGSFSQNHFGLGLGLGLNYFLSPNVALELGPSLRYDLQRNDDLLDLDTKRLRLGLDVGIQFFLNKKE